MRIAAILGTKGGHVHTVLPWTTISKAVDRLNEAEIGALLVCDGDRKIRGILSERDLVRGIGQHGAALLDMAVEAVMTHQVRTCQPDESVAVAMARMTHYRHRHLPVLDKGVLVGMVSIGDLVKHRVAEMELETGVLRDAFIARQ